MEREPLLDKWVNGSIPLPIFQAGLIFAWWVTQLLVWVKPSLRQLSEYKFPEIRSAWGTAKNFNEGMWITVKLSDETSKLITEFRNWIILATHNNRNMSDFSAPISLLNSWVRSNLRISTGKTVTPMYWAILSDAEVFLAEWENRKVIQWINETIASVNHQSKVAFLPYFWEIQALHKRVIQWVIPSTPILDIKTTFPFPIKYIKWKDWWLWEDTIYGRILRWYSPIEVTVEAELKTTWGYVKK